VERFDDVMMNHVASGTRVHLGPGEFKTTGFSPGPPVLAGWQAKSRINIVGAGIESTILRLELDARHAGRQVFAIGHELTVGTAPNSVDFFELSDLTIDCNLAEPALNAVSRGAIRVKAPEQKGFGKILSQKTC
jgi:hypothetical protein